MKNTAVLLLSTPIPLARRGAVAAITQFLVTHQGSIFAECAIALCMVSQMASQTVRTRDFSVVGPGGGGSMFNPAISPHDPSEVLVRCDMTGAFITHDAGRSWRIFNLRGAVRLDRKSTR